MSLIMIMLSSVIQLQSFRKNCHKHMKYALWSTFVLFSWIIFLPSNFNSSVALYLDLMNITVYSVSIVLNYINSVGYFEWYELVWGCPVPFERNCVKWWNLMLYIVTGTCIKFHTIRASSLKDLLMQQNVHT